MLAQSTLDTRLRPFEAVKAVRRLLANPEPDQGSLRHPARHARPFRHPPVPPLPAKPMGARILAERRSLLHDPVGRRGARRSARRQPGPGLSALHGGGKSVARRDCWRRRNPGTTNLVSEATSNCSANACATCTTSPICSPAMAAIRWANLPSGLHLFAHRQSGHGADRADGLSQDQILAGAPRRAGRPGAMAASALLVSRHGLGSAVARTARRVAPALRTSPNPTPIAR